MTPNPAVERTLYGSANSVPNVRSWPRALCRKGPVCEESVSKSRGVGMLGRRGVRSLPRLEPPGPAALVREAVT